MKKNTPDGFTLVEVVIALVVFSIVGLSIISGVILMSKQSQHIRDKAFAAEKVMQMLEELRGVVSASGSGIQSLANLDTYDDGSTFNFVLTTSKDVTNPADVTSGNGALKFKRKVTVLRTSDALSRLVTVRIYDANGSPLAEGSSVMRTAVNDYFPAQVYDVYLLELENVPGWWTTLTTLRPTLDNVIQDLQTRNQGLELRIHYITRLSYGRDPYYAPYVNQASLASAAAMPYVYFYPGAVGPDDNANNLNYYEPNAIYGRYNLDSTSWPNGSSTSTTPSWPKGYSMADQYNHSMRYPDEIAMYAASTAAAAAAGVGPPEISLRMLIEQLNTSTAAMTNALIINTHGEMLPLPPMRNYSDAAKDPAHLPNMRAVSHPENLHYPSGSAVNLRVYAYSASTAALVGTPMISTITVFLPNIRLNPTGTVIAYSPSSDIDISSTIRGGATSFCAGTGLNECVWKVPNICAIGNADCAASTTNNGQYQITNPVGSSGTLITLYGNPVSHPNTGATHSGLNVGSWLYGLEYIPSPPGANGFGPGQNDLSSHGTGPKNTASWVISFKAGKLPDGMVTFETRIGTDTTTGCPSKIPVTGNSYCSNVPSNLSRTYAWLGSGLANQPPATEQYQFIGDPAHMPYSDSKSSGTYNWFFSQTPGGGGVAAYQGYANTSNGWKTGYTGGSRYVNVDLPRYYQVLRQGLLNSTAMWSTMNGWSYYYFGLGGEMGYDGANNFSNGIQIQQRPWERTTGAACAASCGGACTVNEITDTWASSCYSYTFTRAIASTDRTWMSLPWIGELYPDQQSSTWTAVGNLLTAGAAADTQHFFRDIPSSTYGLLAANTTWTLDVTNYVKMPSEYGCSSFLNAEFGAGSNVIFMHDAGTFNNNPITPLGVTQTSALNYPVPTTLTATRPFQLNSGHAKPPEWSSATYVSQRGVSSYVNTVAAPIGVTYDSTDGGYDTSGYVKVSTTNSSNTQQAAYFVISGLATQGGFGTAELGEFALTSMVYDFLQSGDPVHNATGTVTQLPLTTILAPATTAQFNNPSTIAVVWTSTWTRWDGQLYATTYPASYPAGYPEASEPMTYNLKYSKNDGKTWFFIQDNAAAVAGVLDTTAPHAMTGATLNYSWDVSNAATFPMGDYVLRIEEYRNDLQQHYAYHSRAVYISR